jgi:hypothetical protein
MGVVAFAFAITGAQLADLWHVGGSSFFTLFGADSGKTTLFNVGVVALLVAPAIIGIFWGAPLIARELETGTHRLVWNQTVTRSGWLATKVVLIGLAGMAAVGLLSLLVTWWCGPIDDAIAAGNADGSSFAAPRMAPPLFGARGIVPIGYVAFAFAVGVTAGAVIRRTVPAMAVTLVVFVAVQIFTPTLIRQHLGPSQLTTAITAKNLSGVLAEGPNGPVRELRVALMSPGAWDIANHTVDARGRAVDSLPTWVMGCLPEPLANRIPSGDGDCFARLAAAGYRQQITYQPASRYWTVQAIETAIFLALAFALLGFCFWWVRRLS